MIPGWLRLKSCFLLRLLNCDSWNKSRKARYWNREICKWHMLEQVYNNNNNNNNNNNDNNNSNNKSTKSINIQELQKWYYSVIIANSQFVLGLRKWYMVWTSSVWSPTTVCLKKLIRSRERRKETRNERKKKRKLARALSTSIKYVRIMEEEDSDLTTSYYGSMQKSRSRNR